MYFLLESISAFSPLIPDGERVLEESNNYASDGDGGGGGRGEGSIAKRLATITDASRTFW